MSQFGADIFDDEPRKPAGPPSDPPKKRPGKGSRRRKPAADDGAPAPDPSAASAPPEAAASAPAGPATGDLAAGEGTPKKKPRRRSPAKPKAEPEELTSAPPAPVPAAAKSPVPEPVPTRAPRAHDDFDDVLFPQPRGERERERLPTPTAPPTAPAPARSERSEEARGAEARPSEPPVGRPADAPSRATADLHGESAHEGGPGRDDDREPRGPRRRRGRRSRHRDDETVGRSPDAAPMARSAPPAGAPAEPEPWTEDRGDADEGGGHRDAEPVQDPFARPAAGRETRPPEPRSERPHPRDERPHGRERDRRDRPHDRHRDPHRDDRRPFDRDDEAPPARLPRRDLSTARRAPALPEPAPSRRAAVLMDVAELMRQARDCGGELSFRKLRRALLGTDELVVGIAFVPADLPRSGANALAAAGFAVHECADANACADGLAHALADVPADIERLVLAGAPAGLAARTGAVESFGFVEGEGSRGLGAECLFVP